MSFNKVFFSSQSDEWETPQEIFDILNAEFNFDLDVAATAFNAKCDIFFSPDQDGLIQDWSNHHIWCNPPYSNISSWVEKAFRETRNDNTIVVMLIPSRTDTRYFHNFIYQRSEIRFINGRIKFSGKDNAPFPSMIVIFRGANIK